MTFFRRKKWFLVLGILILLAGVAWWQRAPVLAWYHVRQLAAAAEEDRARCVDRVVRLDTAAVPRLLDCLRRPDARVCNNIGAALVALIERWGSADPRSLALMNAFRTRFDQASPPGKQAALQVALLLLRNGPLAEEGTAAAGHLLQAAVGDPALRPRTLALAAALVERAPADAWLNLGHTLAVEGLSDPDPAQRVLAIHLALHIGRRCQTEILQKVVPLLGDSAPTVRRAAVVAVGASPEVVPEDDLLPLLHDADAEVQRLCELALRSRGLPDNHILLGRLITDPHPAGRLKVLQQLQLAPELDPGIWLRRLTQDPERAVRANALHAACRVFHLDLRDRLEQLAQDDPSDTVRQIARTLLNQPMIHSDD